MCSSLQAVLLLLCLTLCLQVKLPGWLHFLFLQKAVKDGIAKGKRAGKGQEPAKPAVRQSTRDFLTTGRAPIRGSTPLGKQIKVTACSADETLRIGRGSKQASGAVLLRPVGRAGRLYGH